MDVGNPVFAPNAPWEARAEARYEQYDRKFIYRNVEEVTLQEKKSLDVTSDMKLSLFGARFYFPTGGKTSAYLDLGYFEGRGATTEGMFVGAGADILYRIAAGIDARINASISYVPDMSYSDSSEEIRKSYNEQWVELSLGVILTRNFRIGDDLCIAPYGGVMSSIVRGDGDITRSIVLGDGFFASRKDSYQIEEDEYLYGLLGFSLFLGDQLSFRAEWHAFSDDRVSVGGGGQGLEDESLSFTLGYAF
jgi:hypothetical protein